MTQARWIAAHRTWLRLFVLTGASLACVLALAQKIDDIPPAVKNNVAPNFMFMIDNSLSMANIAPALPYDPATTYLASCSSLVPAGVVDLQISGGVPSFKVGGSGPYRHTTAAAPSKGEDRKCFNPDPKVSYSARLAILPSGQSYLQTANWDAEYTGNYLNWYFGTYKAPHNHPLTGWGNRKALVAGSAGAVQTRIEIARNSAKSVIDSLPLPPTGSTVAAVRVGLSTYRSSPNVTSPNLGGALKREVADLTNASRTLLKSSIDSLTPDLYTPLASTFADIGRYMAYGYNGNIELTEVAGKPSVKIDTLLKLDGTDGTRNACLAGPDSKTCATITAEPIQQWCQRTSLFALTDGRPTRDRVFNNNTYLKDYDGDCAGNACLSSDRKSKIVLGETAIRTYEAEGSDYMDDVAKLLHDIDLRPDKNTTPARAKKNNITTYVIGFADKAVQNDPLLQNTAKQGDGKFLAATDGPTLVDAFQSIISDALAKDAASAAVAVTNAQITAGSVGYASSYNSGSWYGDLEAYSLDLSTGLPSLKADGKPDIKWSARDKLNLQTAATRKIATFTGTAGAPFTIALNAAARGATTLTDGVINYTRGDKTGEGTTYRGRTYLLGDVINAEPVVVNYASGEGNVFQAANDGMLHVLDGRLTGTTAGQELWAYVPRLVHAKLADRAATTFEHEFLVDGTPSVAEITGAGTVTRILVGGLGKGGAGYYGLNISTASATTEAGIASKVMWEFKPVNMGYSFGTPLIVNTAAGWKVVVASGYRNDTATDGLGGDGRGHVWVLDPVTGVPEKEFITPLTYGSATAALGLAHLGKMANTVADATVRYVYGGDLQGNVWRIDLDAPTLSAPVRVAAVTAPNGVAQPITVPPVIGPVSGVPAKNLIYFGTGQYLSTDDVPGTGTPNIYATQVQTFYGIVDDTSVAAPTMPNIRGTNGGTCPTGGGDGALVCQSATVPTASSPSRATNNGVDLTTKRGFYMDIPVADGRVNTQAALTVRGTLVFVVNKPTNVLCDPGGSSYFFQLSAISGGGVVKVTGGNTYFDAGFVLAGALSSRPVFITTSTGTRAIFRLSDKTTESRKIDETENTAALFRRVYKRQLN